MYGPVIFQNQEEKGFLEGILFIIVHNIHLKIFI